MMLKRREGINGAPARRPGWIRAVRDTGRSALPPPSCDRDGLVERFNGQGVRCDPASFEAQLFRIQNRNEFLHVVRHHHMLYNTFAYGLFPEVRAFNVPSNSPQFTARK